MGDGSGRGLLTLYSTSISPFASCSSSYRTRSSSRYLSAILWYSPSEMGAGSRFFSTSEDSGAESWALVEKAASAGVGFGRIGRDGRKKPGNLVARVV